MDRHKKRNKTGTVRGAWPRARVLLGRPAAARTYVVWRPRRCFNLKRRHVLRVLGEKSTRHSITHVPHHTHLSREAWLPTLDPSRSPVAWRRGGTSSRGWDGGAKKSGDVDRGAPPADAKLVLIFVTDANWFSFFIFVTVRRTHIYIYCCL